MPGKRAWTRKTTGCLLDASVALDNHGTGNLSVLGMYSARVERLFVTDFTPELDARDLTKSDCDTHGIEIVSTTNEQRAEAASVNAQTVLSVYDALNWIVARDMHLTLVTNDRPLWERAQRTGVPFLRGLRLLIILVERHKMEVEDARRIGQEIVVNNSYLPNRILQDFLSALDGVTTAREGRDSSMPR